MSEKLDGLLTATDTAVVELDELQGVIGESQERGFLTAQELAAALEEADLSSQQTRDLLSYFDEHGIEIVGASDSEPELEAHDGRRNGHDPGAQLASLGLRASDTSLGGARDDAHSAGSRHARRHCLCACTCARSGVCPCSTPRRR